MKRDAQDRVGRFGKTSKTKMMMVKMVKVKCEQEPAGMMMILCSASFFVIISRCVTEDIDFRSRRKEQPALTTRRNGSRPNSAKLSRVEPVRTAETGDK